MFVSWVGHDPGCLCRQKEDSNIESLLGRPIDVTHRITHTPHPHICTLEWRGATDKPRLPYNPGCPTGPTARLLCVFLFDHSLGHICLYACLGCTCDAQPLVSLPQLTFVFRRRQTSASTPSGFTSAQSRPVGCRPIILQPYKPLVTTTRIIPQGPEVRGRHAMRKGVGAADEIASLKSARIPILHFLVSQVFQPNGQLTSASS